MYDSFDMACHDEDTALRLNIKVNSENLLPTPQKYNLGSLRLPADPSWPKIPQRRLADDVGDLIQSPCIVTLAGTPRRGRTIVRIPQSQSCKLGGSKDSGNFTSRHCCGKSQHLQNQLPKRRSGCTDPRFKKVTTVKSQMTSTDSGEHEIDKQTEISCFISKECKPIEDQAVPWKDMTRAQVIQQEAEKPDETKGTESVGIQTVQTISSEITSDAHQPIKNILKAATEPNLGIAELRRKSCSPVTSARKQLKPEIPRQGPTLQNRTLRNLEDNVSFKNDNSQEIRNTDEIPQIPSTQGCQGKDEQFFSMVENKGQATHSETVENLLDSTPELNKSQCTKKCYNVQVPVLSYQNVPVQISTEAQSRIDLPPQFSDSPIPNFQSACLFKNIEIPKLELPDDAAPQFLNFGNSEGKQPFLIQQTEDLGFQLKLDPLKQTAQIGSNEELDDFKLLQHTQFQKNRKYQIPEACNNETSSTKQKTEFKYILNEPNILPESQMNKNHGLQFKSSPEKVMKNIHNEEKCPPQQNVSNIFQDSVPKHNFHIYCHQNKPLYRTVATDSESEKRRNLINENDNSNNGQERLTKNGNCLYVHQQTTDSESAQAPMSGIEPKNYSHLSQGLDSSFFDRIDDRGNKNSASLNNKSIYFEQNESRDWSPVSKYKTSLRQKRKMKSEQHLLLNKKRVQSSEPQITSSRRRSQTPYLKKANSYLSKHTQQFSPDSESTYVYKHQQRRPVSSHRQNENKIASEGNNLFLNSQQVIYTDSIDSKKTDSRALKHPTDLINIRKEHCIKPYQRPSHKGAKISSSLDLERQKFSSHKSPGAETDIMSEKPTAIPVKTQQLLNKSYWEYYNKLKLHRMENGESPQQQYFCQVAMGAPQSKKRRAPELIVEESNNTSQTGDQVELSLPEIRTLEQCSVLSTMINKTLDSALQPSSETIRTKQIYLNGNMRSSSDPTAGTQSAILKKLFSGDNEDSIASSTLMYKQKHKRVSHFNNKSSKLKSIGEHPVVFFGCMVYAMIVFLPMIYDYFSHEEHDDYEDLSYVEIAFEYVITSFKEAFGEFIDMIYKIFFKPDARMQRLSSGRWRQKISKHHII